MNDEGREDRAYWNDKYAGDDVACPDCGGEVDENGWCDECEDWTA